VDEAKTLRMTPIDVDRDGNPRDEKLGAAVQIFCQKELGEPLVFSYYIRVWALLAVRPDDADYLEVIGVTGIRNTPDCSLFHIVPLTADKPGLKLAEQARDLAVYRLYSYLEDVGQKGNTVLIFVSESAQRYWRRFLKKIKAEPANRFSLKI
jgi:hypothetical protein